VVTSNGKPIGVLTIVDEDSLEDILAILRQGRAQAAVAELRRAPVARGADRLTSGRIQDVIRKTRRARRARPVAVGRP
jgi:RNA polymerase-interacting CarD/CdnL/TRCF family regulator